MDLYNDTIKNDQRMIDLLWEQRRELVELTARHSQRFLMLALTIKKEHEQEEVEPTNYIPCPNCQSRKNYPTPETMWERFCTECDHVWEIEHDEPEYEYEDNEEIKSWLENWDGPTVPMRWAICGRCGGEGHHGHEYMENMQEGRYDVPCEHHCENGKVRIPDFDVMTNLMRTDLSEWLRSAADYAAEREAERRAGC